MEDYCYAEARRADLELAGFAIHTRGMPLEADVDLDRETGRFSFDLQIPDGQTFESVVSTVFIDADFGAASLVPRDAMDLRNNKQQSMLTSTTDTTRVYTVPFTVIPASTTPASTKQEKPQ